MKLLLVFMILTCSAAAFGTAGVTYHGRLISPAGNPVISNVVRFRIQIRSPGPENCLLFEEEQTQDLSTTNGVFSLDIGNIPAYRKDSTGLSFDRIFSNRGSLTLPGNCVIGSTYAPGYADSRKMEVFFNDGSFAGWEPMPTQTISYVPKALDSLQVGGFNANNLLRVEDSGVPQNVSSMTSTQFDEMMKLILGTSTQYTKAGQLNGSALPTMSNGQTLGWNGGAWTAVTPLTSASLPTCNPGEVLKSNGSTLSCVTDATGGSPVDATTTSKGVVQIAPTGGIDINAGVISLADAGTAGTYYKVTTDAKGRVTSGAASLVEADIPNLTTAGHVSGSAINAGTIGGTAAVNTSGNITTSGTISGNTITSNSMATQSVRIYENTNTYRVNITAPSSLATNYSLILPTALPGVGGQVLSSDTSGNLSWVTPSTGSVTSVTGTAPISVTGTSTPVVSISQANTTTSGYLTATDWNVFNNKLGASSTFSGDVTGTYSSTTIANNAVNSAKIADGSVAVADLDFAGSMATNTGVVVRNGTQFYNKSCSGNEALIWTVSNGWSCSAVVLSESDPKVGTNTTNYLSKWNGSALVTSGVYEAGGNVGVGTATPSEKLEVVGNIKATQVCIGSDCRSAWPGPGGGGTVTSVGSGTGLTGGPITGSGTLNVDVGTTTGKIVQVAAGNKLPAIDGSDLTNLNASNLSSGTLPTGRLPALTGDVTSTAGSNSVTLNTVPISKGGTGQTTATAALNALLPSQGSNSGKVLQTDGTNATWVTPAASGITALTGDVTASGTGSVAATIANNAVNSAKIADGTVGVADLDFGGAMTTNTGIVVRNGTQFFNKTCTANQVLIWTVANGWSCSAAVLSESDPKVGTNTTNYLSKWDGSALVTSGVYESGGNVGIGTTSPLNNLDVYNSANAFSGINIRTPGTQTGQGAFQYFTSKDDGNFLGTSTNKGWVTGVRGNASVLDVPNQYLISYWNGTAWNQILNITPTGNVGIGATSPSEKLEVVGNIKATQLCIGSDCRSAWPGSGGGGTVTSVGSGTGLTGGPITGTGTLNVDVGTTTGKILQVAAGNKLPAVDGSDLTNLNASNLSAGTLPTGRLPALTGDVTSTAGSNSITLNTVPISKGGTGQTTATAALNALLPSQGSNSGKVLQSDGTNATWVTPAASGITALTGDVTASGTGSVAATIANNAVNSAKIADGTVGVADLNFAGTMATNTGIVVRDGTQFFNKTCTANQVLIWTVANGWSCSAAVLTDKVGSNTTNYLSKWDGSALVTSGVYESGGNVGIGNGAPGAKLDVTGNIRASGEIISTNANQFRMVQGNYGVFFRNDGTTTYFLSTASGDQYGTWSGLRPLSVNNASGDVSIGTGATAGVYVQHSTGNLGVGLSNPVSKIHVQGGSLNTGSESAAHGFAISTGSGGQSMWMGYDGTADIGYINAAKSGSLRPVVLQSRGGNVGIGNTNPAQVLDVTGNIASSGDIYSATAGGWLSTLLAGKQSSIGYTPVNKAGDTMTGRLNLSASGLHVATKDNISTRTDSGFFQTTAASTANGWPTNSGGWYHLMSSTHSNDGNYYSMQLAADFYNNDNLYYRSTNGSGTAAWNKVITADATTTAIPGNITLASANPSITSGGSYITIPNGLYVSGGTPYFQPEIQARGGIHNDSAAYLTVAGGTSGYTYFTGNAGFGTTTPTEKVHVVGNIAASGDIYSGTAGGWLSNLLNAKLNNTSRSAASISYNGDGGPQVLGAGGGASMISLHRPGSYAVNFGLDTDNVLKVGGWSMGNNAYTIWHSGNFNPGSYQSNLGYTPVNKAGDTMSGNLTAPDIYADNWFRVKAGGGIFWETYGGGWYMTDSTYIRSYNGKHLYVDQVVMANQGLSAGYGGTTPPAGGAVIAGNVGIGTTTPGQKLTVAGVVESTTGGFKFPDGSTQTTAVNANATAGNLDIRKGNSPLVSNINLNGSTPTYTVNIPVTIPDDTRAIIIGVLYHHGSGTANTHGYLTFDAYQTGTTEADYKTTYQKSGFNDYANSDYTEILVPWRTALTDQIKIQVTYSYNTDSLNTYNITYRGYVSGSGGALPTGAWNEASGNAYRVSGNVGIGTTTPAAKLDVQGEVKFGNTSSTCNGTNEGQQRYNSTAKQMEFCNGTIWKSFRAHTTKCSYSTGYSTAAGNYYNRTWIASDCTNGLPSASLTYEMISMSASSNGSITNASCYSNWGTVYANVSGVNFVVECLYVEKQ